MIGPGVSCPSASPSMNSWAVSQRNWRTTWSSTNARIGSPPPNVNAPTLKKKTPSRQTSGGGGAAAPGPASAGAAGAARPRVAQHDAELRGQRARQEVDECQAFHEALARHPLALALDLRLHDPHHGGAAVAHRPELEEDAADLPRAIAHGETIPP